MNKDRVVVVDDDLKIGNLIKSYLQDEGFDIVVTTNGTEALAAIEDTLPELVIMDMMLPGMNGFELLRKIRENSMVPVVAMSAGGLVHYKSMCLKLGANDYITKPFGLDEFLSRINMVLQRGG